MELIDKEPLLKTWMTLYNKMVNASIDNMKGDEYAVHVAQVTMLGGCIRDIMNAPTLGGNNHDRY